MALGTWHAKKNSWARHFTHISFCTKKPWSFFDVTGYCLFTIAKSCGRISRLGNYALFGSFEKEEAKQKTREVFEMKCTQKMWEDARRVIGYINGEGRCQFLPLVYSC